MSANSATVTAPSLDGPPNLPGTAPTSPVRPTATSPASAASTPHSPATAVSPARPASGPTLPGLGASGDAGVALGLEALERQQEEQERKRQAQQKAAAALQQPSLTPPHAGSQQRHVVAPIYSYRDDDTDPASSLTGDSSLNTAEDKPDSGSTITRFIQNTRRRLSSQDNADPTRGMHMVHHIDRDISEAEMWEAAGRPLISGYLHKFSRNGKWQKRFFESNGDTLSYYKTEARTKMLASLDLCKVGTIGLDPSDSTDCMFSIQVADRPYSLRAETKASAMDWVITLNRIKEAKMQLGHVKLVPAKGAHLAAGQSDEFTPRVVLVANRQRTRAVDGDNVHSIEDMIKASSEEEKLLHASDQTSEGSKRIQRAVVARWKKRRSSLSHFGVRLVRWAKSVKLMQMKNCTEVEEQVVLDHHVHPPGHDDPRAMGKGPSSNSAGSGDAPQGPSAWIGKEAQISSGTGSVPAASSGSTDEDEDVEARHIS